MIGHFLNKGVLKITPCQSETDCNVQNGVKFLSAGLMQAIRNPTAHEPALDWPIEKNDCLDLLSFISFLFRKLDEAVYYKA
ncbi:TIGR02391 family protein [Pontiella sulfatireligans]|uniref:TIGR02391 family protein n=1 Tax=Pontiella sulfatireligans TaxID=2750658 RepID=UPI001C9E79D4